MTQNFPGLLPNRQLMKNGDKLLESNVKLVAEYVAGRTSFVPRVSQSGTEQDFLGGDLPLGFWRAFNLACMSMIKPTEPCVAIASVRNEGPFLIEWIAYHKAIGFSSIALYTNDNTDGSISLLRKLAEAKIITLVENSAGKYENPQVKAYEHSLHMRPDLRMYKWFMYLDGDEFLLPAKKYNYSIMNLIWALEASDPVPSAMCFNWLWMGSRGFVERSRENVTARFDHGNAETPFVKPLLNASDVMSMREIHKAIPLPGKTTVDTAFRSISSLGPSTPTEFSGGRLNHYWNKSFQEFLMKQSRGFLRPIWQRDTDLFFKWDVEISNETYFPLPDIVRSRLQLEQELILSVEGIREEENEVLERYTRLANELCSGDDLEKLYVIAKQRARILGVLASAWDKIAR